ncbi:hypothetical protein [Rickettsiella endosymbiont of Dermanyssus gallinae]|uniref:hypothetical protein n=1 Tax=Rickettsiella endosymbiont of Dermanyssus gallinae TaxID=2856608 RepID=UPI001C533E40|nr:hypothetical protein [Rickettsiella endosymbiont of Dermanyssus gallinae]
MNPSIDTTWTEEEAKLTEFELLLLKMFHVFSRWQEDCEKVASQTDLTSSELSILHTMRQESIVKAMRSRRARDRRALTGEAGNASRRKVICGRHGHELRRSECVPDAGRIAA